MKLRVGYKNQRKLSSRELAISNMMRGLSKWRVEQQVVEAMTKLTNYDGNWLYDEGYFNRLT